MSASGLEHSDGRSELCGSGVGGTVLYCQQSKQLLWAQHLYTVSLGSLVSHGTALGAQQCHHRWPETLWPRLPEGLY